MALDEVLLARASGPLLRTYQWERPAVSFGYFGQFAAVAGAWPGYDLVRRMTGGGMVRHGADLTYSLVVPAGHPFGEKGPRDIYRAVHETLADLLEKTGVAVVFAGAADSRGTGVCFESPVEFDLTENGQKIAGAAMRRTREGLLLQGSMDGISAMDRVRPLMAGAFGMRVTQEAVSPEMLDAAGSLALAKYGTREWMRRV